MMKELQTTRKGRLMIGQAGVFRVASLLILKGHVPAFPSVDTGVDITLDNGMRLQIKSRSLQAHPAYPNGAYPFSTKENNFGKLKRDWTKVVDFLIFWGIDEDRYFIVPAHEATHNFWVRPRAETMTCIDVEAMRVLRDKGMTYQAIAEQFGINDMTVARNLRRVSKLNSPKGNRHLASFEDRWDLLDVNRVVEQTISNVTGSTVVTFGPTTIPANELGY
jgi:hypothetical protein